MLRLVFESETVEYLLPNAPGSFVQEEKKHDCGTGRDELIECAKLGGLNTFIIFCINSATFLHELFVHNALAVKNTIGIVFIFYFWKRSFFGRGECSPTHSEL